MDYLLKEPRTLTCINKRSIDCKECKDTRDMKLSDLRKCSAVKLYETIPFFENEDITIFSMCTSCGFIKEFNIGD